jgi:lipopolysaccharide biosynthesis glycosyltransferase
MEFINQIPYFFVIKLYAYPLADHFEIYHATHDKKPFTHKCTNQPRHHDLGQEILECEHI